MTISSPIARRGLTAIGVVLALLLGLGSIRAAAAWTKASAPLSVTPVSAEHVQGLLAAEQARSADLAAQLQALTTQTAQLNAALDAAQQRITADTGHATDLSKQLKAAKDKLAKLERSIAKAKRTVQRTVVVKHTTVSGGSSSHHGDDGDDDEHEGGDD